MRYEGYVGYVGEACLQATESGQGSVSAGRPDPESRRPRMIEAEQPFRQPELVHYLHRRGVQGISPEVP